MIVSLDRLAGAFPLYRGAVLAAQIANGVAVDVDSGPHRAHRMSGTRRLSIGGMLAPRAGGTRMCVLPRHGDSEPYGDQMNWRQYVSASSTQVRSPS